MRGFLGAFSVNLKIPDYWGIGKSVSRGFGTIKRVKELRSQKSSEGVKELESKGVKELTLKLITPKLQNFLEIIMGKIERFEDILAWQKARELNKDIYEITKSSNFSKDFSLRDQIRRASVSIMANIAEGFGRRSKKEFANYLNMAHGSAAEVQCHLYVALDQEYISQEIFDTTYAKIEEVSRMIQGFMKYLNELKS